MRGNPETDAAARARLAKLMDERRVHLGLTWNEVAERAGLTKEGLRTVRQETRKIMPLTKGGIQEALQWAPGSIDRILSGGEPIEVRYVAGVAALALTATATAHVVKGTAVETETANEITPRAVPRWLATELGRLNVDAEGVAVTIEMLREVAAHYGYTLAELLLEAGLVDGQDLVVDQRLTPGAREALAEYDDGIRRAASSPFLTRRQRKRIEASAAQDRQDAIDEHLGDR